MQFGSWQASQQTAVSERTILPPSRDCEGDERRTKPLGNAVETAVWEGAVSRTNLSQDISPESFHCFRLLAKGSYRMKTLLRHSLVSRFAPVFVLGVALTATRSAVAQPPADSPSDDETPGRVVIERLGEPDSVPDAPAESEATLPEVTVTAPFPRQPLGDDTVVSESPTETARRQVGSSVTVITEQDIQRRGSRTLNEILRTVPGFDVASSGGPGQQTTIFTRGTNGSQTKVLLDGIPLNDPELSILPTSFSTISSGSKSSVARKARSTVQMRSAVWSIL